MVSKEERKRFDRTVAKAQRKTRMRAFLEAHPPRRRRASMASDPPVLVPFEELFSGTQLSTAEAQVRRLVEEYGATLSAEYRRLFEGYRFVHAARKVVSVGASVPRLGRPVRRPRRGRPAVPAGQGGTALGAEPYTAPTEFPTRVSGSWWVSG